MIEHLRPDALPDTANEWCVDSNPEPHDSLPDALQFSKGANSRHEERMKNLKPCKETPFDLCRR